MAIDRIKRRKGDSYRVRMYVNGVRVSRTFDRKIDAIAFEKEAQLDNRLIEAGKLTFAEAAEDWLTNHAEARKAPRSVATDRQMLRDNLLPRFGKMMLAKVTPDQVDRLIQELRKTGIKDNTINKNLQLLRAIFNFHMKRRRVQYNPVVPVGLLKIQIPSVVFWTQNETLQFLNYAEKKYAGTGREVIAFMVKFALNTGMRMGEIVALSWHDVDMDNRLITVRRSYDSFQRCIRESTKGRKIRHVPINSAIYDDLARMRESRRHELVFTINGSVIDRSNLTHDFQRDAVEAGVRKIRFHDLRHTYASHFMMNGGDIYHLKEILGHSDMLMTQRYAHLSRRFLVDKADTVCFSSSGNVIKVEFQKSAVGV